MSKENTNSLKISRATITNFKNIDHRVVEIGGRTMIISGKNEKGKSSLIQALTCSLNSKMIPPRPVKDGEETGLVEIEISGTHNGKEVTYEVGIHFNAATNKGRLFMTGADGKTITSGHKSVLDLVVGDISFDIMEFIALSKTDSGSASKAGVQKQIQILEKLVPSEVMSKINDLKIERVETYDARTEQNREITRLEANIKSSKFTQDEIDMYSKQQSVAEVNDELEKAKDFNAKFDAVQSFLDNFESKQNEVDGHIRDFESQVTEYEEKIANLKANIEEAKNIKLSNEELKLKREAQLKGKSKKDTEAILNKLQNISDFNAKCVQVEGFKKSELDLVAMKKESDKLTDRISAIDVEKRELFQNSNLPVEGLEFDEEGVTYNGLPLDTNQLPSSKILEIGMKIGMALNPHLRLIVIKDGSLLDEDMMKYVIDEAGRNGYQLLIEVVSNDDDVQIEFVEYENV